MALYIPAGRRRRRLIVVATVALAAGLLLGVVLGRTTAPGIGDRVSSVRSHARATAAGLRVVVLHDQAGAAAAGATAGGTELVLQRTRAELEGEIHDAIWLPAATGQELLAELDALAARPAKDDAAFADAAEAMAKQIEATFGA